MTLADLRTAVRNFVREQSAETGALFDSTNTLLDYFLGSAYDAVMLDMARECPERTLTYEDLTLTANTATTTITKEWIQIWTINKTVSGETNRPIPYIPYQQEMLAKYQGETKEDPDAWSISGNNVLWLPTPSATRASYARAWLVPSESSIPVAGPTYLPRIAHRLIPLQAMVLICTMLETPASSWLALYELLLKKVSLTLGMPVQGQPRVIAPAFSELVNLDDRDPALVDRIGYFDRR